MSTLVIAGAPRKAKIRLGPIIERYLGIAILALGFAWVVWNAVSDPVGFKDSLITGINNGAMYALIALGYTMVYGIIELINFAHGDLFMLATVLAANLAVNVLGIGNLTVVGDPARAAGDGRDHGIRRDGQRRSRVSSPTASCAMHPSWPR